MSVLTKKAVDVFAPVQANGAPRQVSNLDVQVWGTELETLVNGVLSMGGKIYASKAQMDVDISPEANTPALVIGDPIAGNNGLYRKIGLSGTGSWQRIGDVPGYQIIPLTNTSAGSANDLVATSALPVPQADRSTILLLNIILPNTRAMTLSVNNENARPLRTNAGQEINPSYVRTGMALALVKEGGIYRLLSDVASAAIQEAAEAAKIAAEHARDIAENYANDSLAGGMDPGISARAAVPGLVIPEGITHFRTGGYGIPGDGGASLLKRVTSEPPHAGKVQSADGSWWELVNVRVTPAMFGVFSSGTANASPGIQAVLDYLEYRGGGILDVSAGNFNITFTHRIASNISIFSAPNTIYKRSADIDCMFISKSDGVTGGYDAAKNIAIIGGIFDCNKDNYPLAASSLAFGHCSDVHLDSITVLNNSGRYHAVEINAQLRMKITNCIFHIGGNDDPAGECLQIDGAYNSGVFPWYGPYDDTPCTDVLIQNCTITDWATAIGTHSLPTTDTRHTNIKIFGNEIKVSRRGINWQGWAGVHIDGNRISGSGPIDGAAQVAIRGDASKPVNHNASDIIISNNTILNFTRDGSGSGSAGRGISIMGWQSSTEAPTPTLQNVRIESNYISGLGGHAIAVEAAYNAKIFGNTIIGVLGNGVYMYGTSRYVVEGNTINVASGKQAINLVSAHGRSSSEGIVKGNHAFPEIYSNAPNSVVTDNITNILNFGSLSTGIKGPNLVNGGVVP